MYDFKKDNRFKGIEPFENKVYLSTPTIHGDEQKWVCEAFQNSCLSIDANRDEVEKYVAEKVGRKYAVALASGTAALHLAIRISGEKLYGQSAAGHGSLEGRKVFASDITFAATVNPICYEGGIPVFIDTEYDTWNMDPVALEKAFELYPEVKLIVMAHLYGTPAKIDEIKAIADKHGAIIVEDAAESFCSTYKGIQTGCFGTESIISCNNNKIITGFGGGFFLTDEKKDADKVKKWSTQSKEITAWYQHEELGYNYRMSSIIAGIIGGQLPYLEEHIEQKKAIYNRYKEGLKDLPVRMNPYCKDSEPNFWLSCLLIDEDAMSPFIRSDRDEMWSTQAGKSSPGEILAALTAFGAEGRPIWKPMHMQPIYENHAFVVKNGDGRARNDLKIDIGADIFYRGLCLPSDNKMTAKQQDVIIDIIHRCFQ